MKRLLATTALLAALASPAFADVIIDNHLSGTGDNVVFNALTPNLVLGSFNGQHQGLVDFTCLGGCGGFTGSQNGNDLKIANFSNLGVQVFSTNGLTVLPTATDVFSITGTGDVKVFVTANEVGGGTKLFTFDLGDITSHAQDGFTLTAINGETIDHFTLLDTTVGGTITDFEHYRIDVAATAVPGPVVGAGLPGLLAGCFALWGFAKRRRHLNA
jgi:opacity protein-like surface antigen